MAFKEHVFNGDELDRFERLHAMEGDNPYVIEIIGYGPSSGVTGATLVRDPDISVRDVVSIFDSGIPEEGGGPVRLASGGLNEHLLGGALAPKVDGYPSEQDSPYIDVFAQVLRETLGERVTALLRVLPSSRVNRGGILGRIGEAQGPNIALLSGGDSSARQQALTAYPSLHSLMMGDKTALETIDKRESLNDLLRDRYDMTGKDLRTFRKINKALTGLLVSETYVTPAEKKIMGDTDHVARTARMLNPDQILDDPASTLLMLRKIDGLEEFCRESGLGDRIVARTIGSISADQWQEAMDGAERGRFVFDRGVTDYLGAVSKPLASAIILEEVRDRHPEMVAPLSEDASRLFSGEDPDADASERLSGFVKKLEQVLSSGAHRAVEETLRRTIGDNVGFKELRERATRWHHINQLIDSEMVSTDMDVDWPCLAGTLDLGDGLRARELNGSAALRDQGRAEKHCVGSYTNVILNPPYDGAKAIFSIETGDEILSTIEISLSRDYTARQGPALAARTTQHQAAGNTPPCEGARRGEHRLLMALNDLPDADGLSNYVRAIHGNPHSLRQSAGRMIGSWKGNVFSETFPETALDACRQVLPRTIRDTRLADLRACVPPDKEGRDPVTRAVDMAFDGAESDLSESLETRRAARSAFMSEMRRNAELALMPSSSNASSATEAIDPKSWLGLVLAREGVETFSVSMSGGGDSGDIDEYQLTLRETSDDPDAAGIRVMERLRAFEFPGRRDTSGDVLDTVVTEEATREGDWFNNEGGTVYSEYHIEGGELFTSVIDLQQNEEAPDEDEFEDDFEDEPEEDPPLFAGQGGV